MKKTMKIFVFALVFCLALCVGALAASGEPSAEPAVEEAVSSGFEVNICVNGAEVKTATIGVESEGNTYKFQIGELLDVLGIRVSYDEETGIATVTAAEDSAFAAILGEAEEAPVDEPSAEPSGEPSAEPAAEEAAAEPVTEEAAETDAVPATDGTENQANVLAGSAAPATAEEFAAYVAYCEEYVTNYTGSGDGTFDDGARAMALGELSAVAFGADVNAFPFEMYVTQFGAMDYATFAASAATAAPAAGDTSEAAYQAYLTAFVMSCEDILSSGAEQEFIALIEAGDYVSFPVEMLFDAQWFGEAAMTYDEFVAAGGVYEIVEHLSNGQMLDGTSA